MEIKKKLLCIIFLLLLLFTFIIFHFKKSYKKEYSILSVKSPIEFILTNNKEWKLENHQTFDSEYSVNNKILSQKLGITEDEAFIIGNFGKYWAKNIIEGRKIILGYDDLVYYKFGYKTRFENSPYSIKNGILTNKYAFNKLLKTIRKGKFVILDLDNDNFYPVSKENSIKINNYIVVRKNHIKNLLKKQTKENPSLAQNLSTEFCIGNIKIVVTDLTSKTKPDRNCSSKVCKEILNCINNANNSIDMAIYGYSSTPEIENAIKQAISRGVKIRIVYDVDISGNNIYPNTFDFVKIIPNHVNDSDSEETRYTMHNKFYIFDDKKVITGSANLSHTDMSGYNSNSIIVIDSEKIALYYKQEFEQMYNKKFHNSKISIPNKKENQIQIFFSPQDKAITNGVLPLIKKSKQYIYIPAFVITEKRITNELINAKNRGVDVKIIADALNASTKHSKHKELRSAGIQVKAENYAGKMHSKTMIIDDEYLIIGSMNFSNSGENRNDENMVIIQEPEAAKFYKRFFLSQWQQIPEKWLIYTPRAEGSDSIGSCFDRLDNNYDGKIDFEDDGCKNK